MMYKEKQDLKKRKERKEKLETCNWEDRSRGDDLQL